MRVLFLVPAIPSGHQPAAGIFHKTQAEALAALGVSVDVVAPVPAVPFGLHVLRKRWARYRSIPRLYALDSLRVYRPRYLHWPLRLYIGPGAGAGFGRAVVRAAPGKPDLVHAHFAYPSGLGAAWLRRRWNVPSVLTLHGSDVQVVPTLSRRNGDRFVSAVTSASAVIAVSESLADQTERLTRRRPVVMPVGIRLGPFQAPRSREAARRRLGLPPEPAIIAYVGQLTRAKGIIELLKALGSLARDGVCGLFVGDGPLRPAVEAAPSVRFYGPQPNDRIPEFLAAADALVLPSHSEGLPTILVEAGAAGTPVIATSVGGIPELLDGGRGLLVPPRSVEALETSVRAVLSDPAAAAERASRLRRHVAEHYDAEINAAHLLRFYQALL